MKRRVWAIVGLVATTALQVAEAQPAPTAAPSHQPKSTETGASPDDVYLTAQEHYRAQRYTEALPLFRKLAREQHSPNARLYLARSLRQVGRLPEAHNEMRETVRAAAARAKTESRFAATRNAARRELAELEARVGFVTLYLAGTPRGLVVELNGVPVPPNRFSAQTAVLPGTVRIRADAPGFVGYRRKISVAAGTTQNIAIALTPVVLAPPPAPGPAPAPAPTALPAPLPQPVEPPTPLPTRPTEPAEPEPDPGGGNGMLVGGVVAIGLAALTGIGAGVTRKMAGDRYDEIVEACGDQPCADPSYDEDIDSGEALDIASHASLGVAGLALLTGGVLITIHFARSDDDPSSPSAGPGHGTLQAITIPGGAALSYGMALPF